MKLHMSMDTNASPEQVRKALLDFSDRRPEIWPELDPNVFTVHEIGDTWAEVTEGSPKPKVWARERYDWSEPDVVSWHAIESNFCTPGSGITVHISEREGGSHLDIDWERTPAGMKWYPLFAVMKVAGPKLMTKNWRTSLDTYAGAE